MYVKKNREKKSPIDTLTFISSGSGGLFVSPLISVLYFSYMDLLDKFILRLNISF